MEPKQAVPAESGEAGEAQTQQRVQMLQVVPGPLPSNLATRRYGHLS